MATMFEVKLATSTEIVDFHVILPDGSRHSCSASSTGNLSIQKGWLGGTTLSARMRDGLEKVRMVAVAADGRLADLGIVEAFARKTVHL